MACSGAKLSLAVAEGRLSGRITDPSGLGVPHAKVVVQSDDTAAARTLSSNQQGEYSVPALLPGPYNIGSSNSGCGLLFRRQRISSTSSITQTLALPQTTSALLYSGNRLRCWE